MIVPEQRGDPVWAAPVLANGLHVSWFDNVQEDVLVVDRIVLVPLETKLLEPLVLDPDNDLTDHCLGFDESTDGMRLARANREHAANPVA